MLDTFKRFFESGFFALEPNSTEKHLSQAEVDLACAALLIEVATIDSNFDPMEFETLKNILMNQFNIANEDLLSMIDTAKLECSEATSMYQFTRLINDHCDFDDKFKLMTSMWRIAFADGDLDKYEEYIIRKISDLIHVSHGDFIRAKALARSEPI